MKEENIGVRYENRFVMVNYEAVMKGELKAQELAIYVILCAFASNDSRSCYPSYATLAEKAGCSRSTAIRTITTLEERGYIEKINQIGEDGNRRSNLYIIKTVVKQAGKEDNLSQKEQQEVVSEEDHPSVLEQPAHAAREGVVSEGNQLTDVQTSLMVSERNGGSVTENHELYLINYNNKTDEGEEEELKQKIEYDYFCRELPERIGFVDILLEAMLAIKQENKPDQQRLLNKVDSSVILDFMEEYKSKPISHVHNYSAWLRTVFLEYLRKREAFQKDFW